MRNDGVPIVDTFKLKDAFTMGVTKQYKPEQCIIKENEIGETAYSIDQGTVRVTKVLNGNIVHICNLKAGDIFGEMGLIDDKPRSATVTAITETTVYEIHRDSLLKALKNEEDLALKVLKVLFERLRKANTTIAELMLQKTEPIEAVQSALCNFPKQKILSVRLQASTRHAAKAMHQNPILIREFPFRIGRKSKDPLAYNDLALIDKAPYRISRHHVELDVKNGKLVLLDRCSNLGTIVNGQHLGGNKGNPGPIVFHETKGDITIGGEKSPFKYKLEIISS